MALAKQQAPMPPTIRTRSHSLPSSCSGSSTWQASHFHISGQGARSAVVDFRRWTHEAPMGGGGLRPFRVPCSIAKFVCGRRDDAASVRAQPSSSVEKNSSARSRSALAPTNTPHILAHTRDTRDTSDTRGRKSSKSRARP